METRFITLIDFNLFISTSYFTKYNKLVNKLYTKVYKFEEKKRKKDEYRKYGCIISKNNRKNKNSLI